MGLLHTINSPDDLKKMPATQIPALAQEVREFLIDRVSKTGGHLGPNLGVVELTIAIHRVFDSPKDSIVWDTGHQSYVHRMFTGRLDKFSDLRKKDGISGYPSRSESDHDIVENSHASTALSWADGIARAYAQTGELKDRHVVAVVGDGSAVLGLGNIGPYAALPVMEGKAALFKRFANVDAWPVCLDTQDVDEIVRTVQLIAPVYGGINLEDISAPRCFEVERRLRELLDIPVFHDDQHGTAIVVLAALRNALKLVKKDMSSVKIVMSGAGAAGTAIARLLVLSGARNIIAFDKDGVINKNSQSDDLMRSWFIENSNPDNFAGNIHEGMVGADIFIGVSAPKVLNEEDVAAMAPGSIVFALANPDPEIDPVIARKYAAVVATGRSDHPNQINNVLAFPGIFRGLLDAHAHKITDKLLVAAAEAIAECVSPSQLNTSFIVPSVFDPNVVIKVAAAVKQSV